MIPKNWLEPIFSNHWYCKINVSQCQTSSLSKNFALEVFVIIFKYKAVFFVFIRAALRKYLLEKSRIVSQAPSER